jgi:hypothetical protein
LTGWALWELRSWNLIIGDGEFCCKQTIAKSPYAVTLSRAPLSYLLYRALFFTLHPRIQWWVEDIIALSSCIAGVVFFLTLNVLARKSCRSSFEFWMILLFPSTTLLLQIFCGQIEFYSWTCTLLMVSAYFAWQSIFEGKSPLWASSAMALSAAFHSSGVFYFPTLLFLIPFADGQQRNNGNVSAFECKQMLFFFSLFIATALLHRSQFIYFLALFIAVAVFFRLPQWIRNLFTAGWPIFLPWLALFTIRAFFGLRAEPLIEHLPPVFEPYDHGAYLYHAFSWDHLYDKTMFHFWLAPFGLATMILVGWTFRKKWMHDRWLLFLANFFFGAFLWTALFYPQLRTRDWDLFASMSIPLNLFALFACLNLLRPAFLYYAMPLMILAHLVISVPIIMRNSHLLEERGYVTLTYEPVPTQNRAFLRGLEVGITPLTQPNVRSGWAEIRVVPLERGTQSWVIHQYLIAGHHYRFAPELKPVDFSFP